ncbi:putative cathepsin B6 cysteine protease [Monocercomonoides exilis]|uniref:putative cathepsin B6 cysteine protease n=1 Tax=Monocercomonoides exilis TaxID=2049356 RepID=UPI003559757C|nr:putative cathepsin B6 cysteine protease [Monocercomonoides exilis]
MFILLFSAVLAESLVEIVNSDPTSSWVAIDYPREVITLAKMRAMLGDETEVDGLETMEYVEPDGVPTSFDARQQWPGKLFAVRNQQSCGSCWAHATSEAVGDRFAIKGCSKGVLSVQDLVSCDKNDNGCNGGSGPRAMSYAQSRGITTETCLPYVSGNGRVPSCPSKCKNNSTITRYKTQNNPTFTVANVQQELMNNGPLYFRFTVYSDFMNYKSGVYQHKSGKQEGGHAVLLVGWGVENGVKYWLCQNSWGPSWGERGFFKILRGNNHCDSEKGFWAGSVKC